MLKMLNYKFYSDFFYPRNLQEIRGDFLAIYVVEHKNPPGVCTEGKDTVYK